MTKPTSLPKSPRPFTWSIRSSEMPDTRWAASRHALDGCDGCGCGAGCEVSPRRKSASRKLAKGTAR